MRKNKVDTKPVAQGELKLDLGCGPHKIDPSWTGVDIREFPGVDVVFDLRKKWPFKDGTVCQAFSSHFIEHLETMERVHFVNELHRVLMVGCQATIIAPHWASCRAYGDLTHKWPPISEFWPAYLDAQWRATNAPHNDFYTCDFTHVEGPAIRQDLQSKNAEYQQFAVVNFKDAIADIHIHLTKR
jgi:hypothetical protein